MDSTQPLGSGDSDELHAFRLSHLCQELMRLAWKSALYNEAYNVCLQGAHGLLKQVGETISYVLENRAASRGHSKVPSNVPCAPLAPSLLLDPHVSQTKGRKKEEEGDEEDMEEQ
ncbi:hypothetical protein Dimus_026882 [Dionaea muscipula]